jgi:rRNA maturation RNase YbeY
LRLERVRRGLLCALEKYGAPPGEVSVVVTDDEELRRMNRIYRGQDSATDVLTFPAPKTAHGQLGDIAVSIEFARRQAKARSVTIEQEVAMLAIHAGLHLAGLDDRTAAQRKKMLAAMNDVAKDCGLPQEADWHSLPHKEEA